ncbi:MAG: TonB-dependent receptor [Deltaproteobacteria bacterium]|nr:TonB-dependent receptor [Deltaproteobacteria bacterium]
MEVSTDQVPSLSGVVKKSPSVQVSETGGEGGTADFRIRGLDPFQNRYFLDGVPLSDAQFNAGNVSLVPTEMISQLDLYAEGVPLYLAEDGLGGALNLHLSSDDSRTALFGSKFGSYDFVRLFGRYSSNAPAKAKLFAAYAQSNEDYVYYDDNSTSYNKEDDLLARRQHNRFKRFTLLPRLTVYADKTNDVAFFSLNYYADAEVPGSTRQLQQGQLKQFFNLSALKWDRHLNDRLKMQAHAFLRADWQQFTGQDPSFAISNQSKQWAVGVRNRLGWTFKTPHHLDFLSGITYEKYILEHRELSQHERLTVPFGISSNLELPDWSVSLRPAILSHYFRYSDVSQAAWGRTYLLASPRIGLTWMATPNLRVRSTVGKYYRAPSMYELFGDASRIAPSPSLMYESATKGDLGADIELNHPFAGARNLKCSYSFFISRASDLITYLVNSQQTRVAANIGESAIWGHEMGMTLESALDINLDAALTLLSTRNLSNISYQVGKALPSQPSIRFQAGLAYAKKGWQVGYQVSVLGNRYLDLANTKELSTVIEHNASVGLKTKTFGIFGLEVRNLTDVITVPSLVGSFETIDNSTGFDGYPAPGRRLYLTWQYPFL